MYLDRLLRAYTLSQDGRWRDAIDEAEPTFAAAATVEQRCVAAALQFHAYNMLEKAEEAQTARLRFDQESAPLPPEHTVRLMMQVFEGAHEGRRPTPEQSAAFWAVPIDFLGELPVPETLDNAWDLFWKLNDCLDARAFHMMRRYGRALSARTDASDRLQCYGLLYLLCGCLWLDDREEAIKVHERLKNLLAQAQQGEAQVEEQKAENEEQQQEAECDQFWYTRWTYVVQELRGLEQTFGIGDPDAAGTLETAYVPPVGDGYWQTIDVDAAGLSAAAVAALREYERDCRASGADAFLVVRQSKIISEWYAPDYTPPLGVYSCTKSWTSLLTGMLIADGKLGSIDDPIGNYLPEWQEGVRGRVTLKHLLTMTSGLTAIGDRSLSILGAEDVTAFARALTPSVEPGTEWSYSNEGVQLLAPILEQAAGMSLRDYARTRLFAPLGMTETEMSASDRGQTFTFGGGLTSLRDFGRLGVMLLNGGRWQERQIVPEEWIDEATSSSPVRPDYGYLFWLDDDSYAMKGDLNNECYCFPAQEMVVIRQQADRHLRATPANDSAAFTLFGAMTGHESTS